MATKSHYSEYVADKKMIDSYNEYQKKYKAEPRESDKVSLSLTGTAIGERRDFSLLDIGCSTGNFLFHCREMFPAARLTGADLASESVEQCKHDSELIGIKFVVSDILDLQHLGKFDVITANAVAVYFDHETYRKALKSVADSLNPGGSYVAFEWIHLFSIQELTIVETSDWNPDGLTFRFRPTKKVENSLKEAGFDSVDFYPFLLPFDLPHPGHDADVVTYTRKDEQGERLAFRGVLYQPWCHFVARKAG